MLHQSAASFEPLRSALSAQLRAGHSDQRLIDLCKRAKRALEQDLAALNLMDELTEKYEAIAPAAPTHTTALGAIERERDDVRTMRGKLADGRPEWSQSAVRAFRARIATVAAFEKECDRLKREIGLNRAEAANTKAMRRGLMLVEEIIELRAATLPGLARKAALLPLWKQAGYCLSTKTGEALAFSIAEDARSLCADKWVGGASARQHHRRQPPASAH